jgi:predicted acylesterase/phospholipase RssA
MEAHNAPFRVLSLSGGGIRGLHTARILEVMEAHLKAPVAHRVDLLCGTSIGGILALALALERPASVLRELLEKRGAAVFARPLRRRLLALFRAKHDPDPLRRELTKVFGQATLGDLLHPVVIPAVDASAGVAIMFKTPHHAALKTDQSRPLVDVALATAAAPTYFPIFRASDSRLFVDGGLVANAPGLCGLHEAELFFDQDPQNVHILAIGTASVGRNIRSGKGPWARDLGTLRWGVRAFDLTISAQESLVHSLLTHRCQGRYTVVDSKIDTQRSRDVERLNHASPAAIETLLAAAARTAQQFLGTTQFDELAAHRPQLHPFFYGPRALASGGHR